MTTTPAFMVRLQRRFRQLQEAFDNPDLSWKSPEAMDAEKKRSKPGPAYYALMRTAGPATDHPVWSRDWTTPNGYTFKEGTPAPRWTHEEIHKAMAAQIKTMAWAEANKSGGGHRSRQDPNAVDEIAGNMHVVLQSLLHREKDEGRILGGEHGGFVAWATPHIRGAGGKGMGSTVEWDRATKRIEQLKKAATPAATRKILQDIMGKVAPQYQTTATDKAAAGNTYGRFSPALYNFSQRLLAALDGGDQQELDELAGELDELEERIADVSTEILGTHTGKKIITTPHGSKPPKRPPGASDEEWEALKQKSAWGDREQLKRTQVSSMTGTRPDGGEGQIDITDPASVSKLRHIGQLDSETLYSVLSMARNTPRQYLERPELRGKGLQVLRDYDFRYLIRNLAQWLPDGRYPGKGTPGKDPELAPDGTPSNWIKNGQPQMWDNEEIVADIGEDPESEVGGGMDELLSNPRLTELGKRLLGGLAAGKMQSQMADEAGVSKVAIGNGVKRALKTLGMDKQQFMDYVAHSGSVKQSGPTPLEKFAAWMRQYEEEQSLDESVGAIELDIIRGCRMAIVELCHHYIIRPMLCG